MNIIHNYSQEYNKSEKGELNQSKEQIKNTQTNNPAVKNSNIKPDILDIFSKKVINPKDVNDMVTVPRAIFKGYLYFTTGTALNAVSGILKKGNLSKGLTILGSVLSIVGTFNFVKPFLYKKDDLTKSKK